MQGDQTSSSINIKILEEPAKGNEYKWVARAIIDNLHSGIGMHQNKQSAIMLAKKNALDESLGRRAVLMPKTFSKADKLAEVPAIMTSHATSSTAEAHPSNQRSAATSNAPGILKLIGQLGHERGEKAEELVFNAFAGMVPDAPSWFVRLERATPEQDRRGIDAIVVTNDLGELFIQIKSSLAGFMRFLDGRPQANISCIVVTVAHTDKEIRQNVYAAASALRRNKRHKLED